MKLYLKIILGSIVGFISAITGIGGAVMNVPILKFFGYSINKAIGSAAAIGFLIALVGATGFIITGSYLNIEAPLSVGFVNIPAFLIFVPITMFMAKIGAKTVHRVNRKLVGKLFGSFIQFHYDVATKKLTITQRPRADQETVLMHTDNFRPDITLFKDIYSKPWIRDYTLAVSKVMIGEARGKFNTIAGPQGGTTLNGAELKQQGQAEMERLEAEIGNYAEGGTPHSFVIG